MCATEITGSFTPTQIKLKPRTHQYPDVLLTLTHLTVHLQKPQSEYYPLEDLCTIR